MIRSAALLLAFATAAGAQQPETGTFTLVQNGQTIATETFTRSDASLETELTVTGQATFQTSARLRADATVARLEVRVFGPGGATAEPIQTSAVSFDDGSVALEQPIGTPVGEPAEVETGAVPYLNPSPAYMEQILRRARAMGGDTLGVSVWTPGPGGGQVISAVVAFDGDTATLSMGGVAVEIVTDPRGRLLEARIPSQSVVIERE